MTPNPLLELGAGLSSKSVESHPSGPPQHGPVGQAERGFAAASTFMSGIMAISATQFLGAPLKMIDPKFYEAYMAFTKQSFGVLITTMTQWWSPTVVRVSGDKSIPKQLFHKPDGTLECRFPKRLVMMANHQLYTDWLYLWWVAYTNNMHGYIYIILKESLKNIPVIGWGAQFYNFIFLSRKWEQDQASFQKHLDELNNAENPMWLLIFPEGTNLAKGTREKSKQWAEKTGVKDMKHQLLPRSKGLQFCLQNLKDTTEWLYDCTIGYEGIPPEQFGQDIFTLRSSMFEGRPPKSVNMHFRRFRISEIPIDNDKAFDIWLRNRWREKDYLLEHFVQYDRFPEDENWLFKQKEAKRKGHMNAKFIETQIKTNNLEEFLSIFAPLSSVMMVLNLFYGGQNPEDLMKLVGEAAQQQQKLALVRDEGSTKMPLRIEKAKGRRSRSSTPSIASIKSTPSGITPAAAQRNMVQQYITAVKPTGSKAVSLPDTSKKMNGKIPIRSTQSSAGGTKKRAPFTTSTASAKSISTFPTTPKTAAHSSQPSVPSTASTAPSFKPKPIAAVKLTNQAPATPTKKVTSSKPMPLTAKNLSKVPTSGPAKPTAVTAPSKIAPRPATIPASKVATPSAAPKPSPTKKQVPTTVKKQDPPTVKMDKATFDRLRQQNQQNEKKREAPKSINIDPAVLAKMKEANAKKAPKKVTIDPGILAKMKEAKKT